MLRRILMAGAMAAFWASGSMACAPEPREFSPATGVKNVPLSSLGPNAAMLVIDERGRIVRRHLRSGETTVVYDVEGGLLSRERSPDGRWLLLGGYAARGSSVVQYWLYDLRSGIQQAVLVGHPSMSAVFLPDSRGLLAYLTPAGSFPKVDRAGLYVVDLASLGAAYVGHPGEGRMSPGPAKIVIEKSAKGGEPLVVVSEGASQTPSTSPASHAREYFAFSSASRELQRLDAKAYADRDPMEAEDPRWLHLSVANGAVPSPDRRWIATVKDGTRIFLGTPNGAARRIAAAGKHPCHGTPLRVVGWLDSKHLLYAYWTAHFHSRLYVVEASSGRTARLDLWPKDKESLHYSW